MARKKYSSRAQAKVGRAMHERKAGTLRSGSGAKVTSRKQAIAIGLSEARAEGAKVPKKRKAGKRKSKRKSKGSAARKAGAAKSKRAQRS
jgi:hypothetical protein